LEGPDREEGEHRGWARVSVFGGVGGPGAEILRASTERGGHSVTPSVTPPQLVPPIHPSAKVLYIAIRQTQSPLHRATAVFASLPNRAPFLVLCCFCHIFSSISSAAGCFCGARSYMIRSSPAAWPSTEPASTSYTTPRLLPTFALHTALSSVVYLASRLRVRRHRPPPRQAIQAGVLPRLCCRYAVPGDALRYVWLQPPSSASPRAWLGGHGLRAARQGQWAMASWIRVLMSA
jgi:hypothetical protein